MHMFLTGAVQVGKSTLLNRWLAFHPEVNLGGFRTLAGPRGEDGGDSVHMVPAAGPVEFSEANCVLRRARVRPGRGIRVYPEVFDRVGVSLLAGSKDCEVILMDEIGVQEDGAARFRRAVLECLDGDIPVLGVVRGKAGLLTDAVRAHPKVKVAEVTPENRPEIFELLMGWPGAEGTL